MILRGLDYTKAVPKVFFRSFQYSYFSNHHRASTVNRTYLRKLILPFHCLLDAIAFLFCRTVHVTAEKLLKSKRSTYWVLLSEAIFQHVLKITTGAPVISKKRLSSSRFSSFLCTNMKGST